MARLSLLAIAAAAVLLAAAPAAADDHQMGMGAALSNFTLPTLPYGTDEFEPSIDNATMWLHWNRYLPSRPAAWLGASLHRRSPGGAPAAAHHTPPPAPSRHRPAHHALLLHPCPRCAPAGTPTPR